MSGSKGTNNKTIGLYLMDWRDDYSAFTELQSLLFWTMCACVLRNVQINGIAYYVFCFVSFL